MATMPAAAAPRRRFLGWDTVVGGAAIQLLQGALFYQSFGIYVVAWTEGLGWSLTAVSGGYALVTLLSGLLGLVHGRLLERAGARRVVLGGMLLLSGGMALLSTVTTLPGFYAAMAVTGVGLATSGFLSITTAIVPWFVRRRSTALSLMSVGISLGGLFVPLIATTVLGIGWRPSLQLAALVFLASAVPLAVLMRRPPAAYGQEPDGGAGRVGAMPRSGALAGTGAATPAGAAASAGATASAGAAKPEGAGAPATAMAGATTAPPLARPTTADPTERRDHTLPEALRTRAFWLLGVGHGVALLVVATATVHLIPHLADGVGLSLQRAAAMVALVTVMSGIGQLVGGPIGDRFDKRRIAAWAMLAHALALLVLAWGPGETSVVLFAVMHGLAWGIRGPLMTSLRADYFGTRHFGSIMGASVMLITIGQLAGPILAGTMADLLGDYRLAFTVVAGIAGLASASFWAATPPPNPGGPAPQTVRR
jgi:MFS family permease